MDNGKFVKNLPTGVSRRSFPRSVAFANNSKAVIGGSDHGCVYIFDRKTAKVLKTLKYCRQGIETIAVCGFNDKSWRNFDVEQTLDNKDGTVYIAIAAASGDEPSPISLWIWKPDRKKISKEDIKHTGTTLLKLIEFMVRLGIIFAVVAYMIEVFRTKVCEDIDIMSFRKCKGYHFRRQRKISQQKDGKHGWTWTHG